MTARSPRSSVDCRHPRLDIRAVIRPVGLLQLSAQQVDGQKLCVLIGKNGGTVAYLHIPPGLDPDPMLARKVGVRGVAHYDEDLQSRLITVRTLEPIESSAMMRLFRVSLAASLVASVGATNDLPSRSVSISLASDLLSGTLEFGS